MFSDIGEVLQREHDALKELAARIYSQHAHLVELSQTLKTKTMPNEHAFFRSQSKEDSQTPASAVVRPVLGGMLKQFRCICSGTQTCANQTICGGHHTELEVIDVIKPQ